MADDSTAASSNRQMMNPKTPSMVAALRAHLQRAMELLPNDSAARREISLASSIADDLHYRVVQLEAEIADGRSRNS